jgi:hypothetical protein
MDARKVFVEVRLGVHHRLVLFGEEGERTAVISIWIYEIWYFAESNLGGLRLNEWTRHAWAEARVCDL